MIKHGHVAEAGALSLVISLAAFASIAAVSSGVVLTADPSVDVAWQVVGHGRPLEWVWPAKAVSLTISCRADNGRTVEQTVTDRSVTSATIAGVPQLLKDETGYEVTMTFATAKGCREVWTQKVYAVTGLNGAFTRIASGVSEAAEWKNSPSRRLVLPTFAADDVIETAEAGGSFWRSYRIPGSGAATLTLSAADGMAYGYEQELLYSSGLLLLFR